MRKIFQIMLYIALIVVLVMGYYHSSVFEFIARLRDSKSGILLSLYNYAILYFKNADSMNLVFLVLFFCISLLSFVMIDSLVIRWLGKLLSIKAFTRFDYLLKPWILLPLQKLATVFFLIASFILLCNGVIVAYGLSHSTTTIPDVPAGRPVLVLGTSKRLSSGKGENLYFSYRIEAALLLWRSGKASYFIASGDRKGEGYDETRDILNDLVAAGVPEDKVLLDTAGYRTLDSMLRIRQMYRTKELVIVTQPFHSQRALFLAKFYGMDAIAFSAKGSATSGMLLREFFSKPKLIMDVIFFNMQPKVLVGSQGPIQYRESFQVTSDLHVVFLFVLAVAVLSTLGLTFKHLD